jgi:predicted PurR-regulated permease PerM
MLLLVFAAVVLATALNSLVRRLQTFGMRRSVAILCTMLALIGIGGIFIGVVFPPFVEQFVSLIELIPKGLEEVVGWVTMLAQRQPDLFRFGEPIDLSNLSNLAQQIQPLLQNLIQNFLAFFSNSFAILLQSLLVVILTFMLLANPIAYRQSLIQLFPSFYRRRADDILVECEIALGNWFGGIVISSVSVGLLSGIGLLILQVRLVLAHALLAGLLNFIPNIGPALSVAFPLFITLVDSPWKSIAVIILYVIIQNVESYWLTPTVMAHQVSLLPAITLSAQIFFATFFGFLGLLLALPLTVVAKVWIQEALIKDVLDRCQSSSTSGVRRAMKPSSLTTNALSEAIAPTQPVTNVDHPTEEAYPTVDMTNQEAIAPHPDIEPSA